MKKIAVMFGFFLFAAMVAVSVDGFGNYSSSNSSVQRNVVGVFIADGSPRPPVPPGQSG